MIPCLSIPDIRDFDRINAELIQWLDRGQTRVRLSGAERQRMLAFGLVGSWKAVVEIEGVCGPEVAAELDAPNLTVLCLGDVADGAGRGLRAGRLLVRGSAGDGFAAGQSGGLIAVRGAAGDRTGLRQSGGELVLLGRVGRLASERRTGGTIRARRSLVGPHFGWGAAGGAFVDLDADPAALPPGLSDRSDFVTGGDDHAGRV